MLRFLFSLLQLFLVIFFAPFAAAQSNRVGEIVFVSGEVELQGATGARQVKTGDAVAQGEELITKANGYVYIKTRDNGFISLRPNSAVQFEIYQYLADKPQDSRFKTNLRYGVMRSVSGIGAHNARDRYRLNTPVAAIGIRGTDFTVYATADLTRATVTSGGIVMSGFNDNCTPSGNGPCSGEQIAELYAKQSGMLLQLRRGESRPILLSNQSFHLQPDSVAPPLPNETSDKKPAAGHSNAADVAGEQAIVVRQDAALQTLNQAAQEVPSAPPLQPLPPPPAQQVFWGRWLPLASESGTGGNQVQTLLKDGKKLVALNSIFGLVREQQTNVTLPSAGIYNFALQSHESYILNERDRSTVAARIENPSLSIDFNQQRFDSRFQVLTDQQKVNVKAVGSVLRDGSMISDQIGSTAAVQGALVNGGQQAGFLYEQRIDARQKAVGATYWSR